MLIHLKEVGFEGADWLCHSGRVSLAGCGQHGDETDCSIKGSISVLAERLLASCGGPCFVDDDDDGSSSGSSSNSAAALKDFVIMAKHWLVYTRDRINNSIRTSFAFNVVHFPC
jgi:hypothetical protein